MEKEEFVKKLAEKIETEQLQPKPKWEFVVKNWVFFIMVGLSVILGSFAVATSIFLINDQDWDIYQRLHHNFIQHLFLSIPYIWIITIIILVVIAYTSFTKTKSGYKYASYQIIIGSILASLIFGGIIYAAGFDSGLHELFSKQIPGYRNLVYDKNRVWHRPEDGLIAGEITVIKNENSFEIRDFIDDKKWLILTDEKTDWEYQGQANPGMKIRIIGTRLPEGQFQAKTIRPWKLPFRGPGGPSPRLPLPFSP